MNGSIETGAMKINNDVVITLLAGEIYAIPNGYHSGLSKVTAASLSSQTPADATTTDIIYPYKGYVNGALVTGSLTEKDLYNDYASLELKTSGSIQYLISTFPRGVYANLYTYYNGNKIDYSAIKISQSVIASLGGITSEIVAKNKSCLGIDGSFTSDATATVSDIKKGEVGYSNGQRIVGELISMAPYLAGYSITNPTSVVISWNNPSVGPYGGVIIRKSTVMGDIGTQVYKGTGSNTVADGRSSVSLVDLIPNTTYYFTITGYCGDLDESDSYTITVEL